MKKTLLAAALLTGFAGAASAQSSVTLYGVTDLAIRNTNTSGPSGATNNWAMASGTYNTSRFGLKGVEDLGSGNQAFFQYEAQIDANSGAGGTNGGSGTTGLFQRHSTLGLQNAAWGSVVGGRSLNQAFYYACAQLDNFQCNMALANMSSTMGIAAVRYSNSLVYNSPSMSGFKASVGYSFNTGMQTALATSSATSTLQTVGTSGLAADTANQQRAVFAAASYTNGPVYVTGTYDQITSAGNMLNTAGLKVTSYILGASYDAKVVKITAAYNNVRGGTINLGAVTTGTATNPYGAATNQQGVVGFSDSASGHNNWMVGAKAPIGGNSFVFASYQNSAPVGAYVDAGLVSSSIYAVGYQYDFTKRTAVYGTYANAQNYLNVSGLSNQQVTVGMRHSF